MESGDIQVCEGFFYDDGSTGGNYSDNDYVFTICPDNPGDVISVEFVFFDIYNGGSGNADYLEIFDGDDVTANSLGAYTGNQLSGLNVTGTTSNTSGCLTFRFNPLNISSNDDFPGWEGIIECTTPCDAPTAASHITDPLPDDPSLQSVSVCLGQEITFEDDGSTAAPGFTLDQYIWNFQDGTLDSTSGPVVTHTFETPGEYVVTLVVEDNNGCQSTNLDPLQVLVSTVPEFNTEFEDTICLGQQTDLNGNPFQSITWTSLPPQVVSGETYLADDAGQAYESSLSFDFFEAGATLEDCSDLESIFVNMEHSYMGDLNVEISCPDGTSVILVEYPNGGGGSFLGVPIGDDAPTPGVGWDYFWSPEATNGTWSDNAPGFNESLPSGTYESDYDLCNLVGCPLNGDWTFSITDNLGLDNGFVFEWGINFNPDLFPGITTFTPIIGEGSDSTYWSGDHIVNTSGDGNLITVEPPNIGSYDYTFTAINNFGCAFDTTVTLTVLDAPEIDPIMDTSICSLPLVIQPSFDTTGVETAGCEWTLDMQDSFGDGWNGNELIVTINGTDSETFTFTDGNGLQDYFYASEGDFIEIEYVEGLFVNEVGFTIYDPSGEIVADVNFGNASGGVVYAETAGPCTETYDIPWTFNWEPPNIFNNPNSQNGLIDSPFNGPNNVTLNLGLEGVSGCNITEEFVVNYEPVADPGVSTSEEFCYDYGQYDLFDLLGGNPDGGGEWTDPNGDPLTDTVFESEEEANGTFTYSHTTAGGCSDEATVEINILLQGTPSCCEFDYTFDSTPASCANSPDGEITIDINSTSFNEPFTLELYDVDGNLIDSEVTSDFTYTFEGVFEGDYSVTLTDEGTCTDSFDIAVTAPELAAIGIVSDTTICVGGTATLYGFETTSSGVDIEYVWNGGEFTGDTINVQTDSNSEVFTVVGQYGAGCETNTGSVVVNRYNALQMDLMDDTTICINENIALEAQLVTGGLTPYEYNWTAETGQIFQGNGVVTSLTDTTEFCLEVSDACESPTIEECVTISVYPQIDSTFTADTLSGCEPLLVNFTPNGDTTAMDVAVWSFGDGQSQTHAGVTSHLYENFGEFDVTFEIISTEGCVYTYTEENFIDVYQVPVAQFSPEPETAILPSTTFEFTNLSFNNDFNEWTFGEYGISDEENPIIEIPTNGTEIIDVQLIVSNEEGCVDTTSRTVYIQEDFQMYIPNAFTPNGDGINDYFDLTGIDVDPYNFKLYIYDRWGNLVHFTNDITEGWDGSYQRRDHYVPNDVYIYRIETQSLTTSEKKEVVGHVTIIRQAH